jgi:NAD(P)-dependent dehydrogenase (short-subunit alcohol dehydrogenase family)
MSFTGFSLEGRRALVTGASGGIGRAIALGLAQQGADLALHHLGEDEAAAALAREIEQMGRRATVHEADFTQPDGAAGLAASVLTSRPVDILIANAAMEARRPWREIDDGMIASHVAVNFSSLLTLMQRLLPSMQERGWGRVVALGSVMAARPRAETAVYAALKSAQLTAMRAIARDVAGQGVTLNVISPGAIRTERNETRYAEPAFRAAVAAKIPAGREGVPADCLAPVLMLCSDAAGYITGADIPIDGGWSIGDPPGVLPGHELAKGGMT